MNAPIKLYISPTIYNSFQYRVPDPDDEFEVEYINKEAFLTRISEWLSQHSQVLIIEDSSQESVVNITDFRQFLEALI